MCLLVSATGRKLAVRAPRQKLEAQPWQPRLIVNEPGVGYRLNLV
jgi:DNA-binding response OmpR family regulator